MERGRRIGRINKRAKGKKRMRCRNGQVTWVGKRKKNSEKDMNVVNEMKERRE